MRKYITTAAVTVLDGIIALSTKQATRREASLEKMKPGIYRIMSKIQLKAGEEVGFDKAPKMLMQSLTPTKKAKPE